jgi:MraZ protein
VLRGFDGEDGRERSAVFLGEYFHSLDGKGRVVMPSSFRRRLEDGCVVSKGQDGQLVIFSAADFEKKASEVIELPQDRDGRRFSRTVFGGADLQTLDKSGRVLVKPDLREFADIETATEVAVVGVFDHVELWSKEVYVTDRETGDVSYRDEEA